ncbi:methyltransferase [Chromatiaceae bacterium AAb-1]|nr:methyltransferase [Chromatiaceae bacterium AAb-1]
MAAVPEKTLAVLFADISKQLQQHRQYWQLVPFACQQLPWQQTELTALLWSLPDDELAAIDQSPALQQQYFQTFFPELFRLPLWHSASFPATAVELPAPPFWLTNGIGGRKLLQIEAISRFLPPSQLPVLEWCAGKGHLGRLLAFQSGRQVTSVEWQQALCDDGQTLAEQYRLPQKLVQADVLQPQIASLLHREQQVIALHACGQLHIQLLQQAATAHCRQLHLVPCCYHLITQSQYQPQSEAGTAEDLQLSLHDLRLAVQGQVTAGERVSRLRQTETEWRLAWQALRQDLTGQMQYVPLASVAKHWFQGEFSTFANWAAQQHKIALPAQTDWQHYLVQGRQRSRLIRRIELVRHLFRRPLELWLVLDKALFLQQQGYRVSVKAFCDYQVTPRNLLIEAELLFGE